jgi:hypothetical protein
MMESYCRLRRYVKKKRCFCAVSFDTRGMEDGEGEVRMKSKRERDKVNLSGSRRTLIYSHNVFRHAVTVLLASHAGE